MVANAFLVHWPWSKSLNSFDCKPHVSYSSISVGLISSWSCYIHIYIYTSPSLSHIYHFIFLSIVFLSLSLFACFSYASSFFCLAHDWNKLCCFCWEFGLRIREWYHWESSSSTHIRSTLMQVPAFAKAWSLNIYREKEASVCNRISVRANKSISLRFFKSASLTFQKSHFFFFQQFID